MTSKIQARIDTSLKEEGEAILQALGMTTTDLMRMTFRQMVMRQGLPFDVKIPNAATRAAIEEAKGPLESQSLEEFLEEYDLPADTASTPTR